MVSFRLYPGDTSIGGSSAHGKTWWVVVATHRLSWLDSEKYWRTRCETQAHNEKNSDVRSPDHWQESLGVLKSGTQFWGRGRNKMIKQRDRKVDETWQLALYKYALQPTPHQAPHEENGYRREALEWRAHSLGKL